MSRKVGLGILGCLCIAGCQGTQVTWQLDRLESIGDHAVEVVGSPRVVADGTRKAVCFDGAKDGLFISVNPIEQWPRFTVEILFKPEGDGNEEQRFLHIEDDQQRRLLIETRVAKDRTWSLDTFLRASDRDRLTLLDRAISQPTDQWYWAALVYDGKMMRHYVDGKMQLEGAVSFPPMGRGRISLGVRQNRIHWFKGCIAQVRFTAKPLSPQAQQTVNGRR